MFGLTLYEIAAALGTKSNENSFNANVANYIDKKQKAEQAERTLKAAQYEQARRAGEEAAAAAREWAAAAQKAMHALKHPKQGEEQTKKKEEETITQGGGTKLQRREIKDDLVKGTSELLGPIRLCCSLLMVGYPHSELRQEFEQQGRIINSSR